MIRDTLTLITALLQLEHGQVVHSHDTVNDDHWLLTSALAKEHVRNPRLLEAFLRPAVVSCVAWASELPDREYIVHTGDECPAGTSRARVVVIDVASQTCLLWFVRDDHPAQWV